MAKLPRRRFLHLAAGAAALPVVSGSASALDYPNQPVHIIVGFPAGLGPDIAARLIAPSLSERLGQQFIVENHPGAASNIGTEIVVRAPPDGYTLLLVTGQIAINATLYDKLSFDIRTDIAPVASVANAPFVMVVNPSVPIKTVPEFIAYAKSNPGKIKMASNGNATTSHLSGKLFEMMTGVDLLHVPYSSNYFPDLLGGKVQLLFGPITQSFEYIKADKLRILAVTTASRSPALPDVPTVAEAVPGYEVSAWYGIGAPRQTSREIVQQLNAAVNSGLTDPGLKPRFAELGGTPLAGSPDDFGKLVADEIEKWGRVIRAANIKL